MRFLIFTCGYKILTPPHYLTSYMRDTYGLTDEEINHVWLRYKDIILDRIKKRDGENNPFRITESKDKQEQFLDTILKDVLNNTTIEGGGDEVYIVTPPVGKDFFNFERWLETWEEYNQDDPPSMITDYMVPMYGLTKEESKIIWIKYKNEILKRIKKHDNRDWVPFRIHESTIKKQNEYFNRILDQLEEETIIQYQNLKFPFLSPGMDIKDLYNHYYPSPNIEYHFLNHPLNPNMTTISYKIGGYMKSTYGVTEEEVEFIWDLYRQRIKEKLSGQFKKLPSSIFNLIQADLVERTVKIPNTNKPLCTGGESVDYRDIDNPFRISANQEGAYDQPNFVIQLNLPSSEYPYNVEMGRGRSWGQLNDYLTQQYGLTDEECQRVWDEYRGTICKKPQLPTLHESEDAEIVFTTDKKKEKQQKVLDYALEDLTDNTLLDWGNSPDDTYQIIQFPFSIYPHEDPKKNRLEWIMIDKHYNLDIAQFYKQFKPYAQLMYGLTEVEILLIFAKWEGNIIKKIRDHSETNPDVHLYDNYPQTIEESKNVISESNIEKLINRVVGEIYNAATAR